MTITTGVNSFTTESEFYSHLATRLNGDDFTYLSAVLATGINDPAIAKVFDDMRGASLADIKTALTTANIAYIDSVLDDAFALLTSGGTKIQAKNAQALILATQLIDPFDFIGQPTETTQPLQWPRVGAVERNGQSIPADSIPNGIKTATAELAFFLLKHDITDPRQHHHLFLLTSERIGEVQNSYSKRINKKLPDNVMDLLKPFLLEKSAFSSTLIN